MSTLARRGIAVAVLVSTLVACQPETTWYKDVDGDGYGNSAVSVQARSQPSGYVARGGDCADDHIGVYPGAPDVVGDAVADNDCDGVDDGGSEP